MGFHPSSRSYSISTDVSNKITNLPSGGGNKLQGIPPTIAYRNELLRHIIREAYNPPLPRTIITCINQIGGIGRNRSQFLPTADGTNGCKCSTTNVYTFSDNLISDPFFANVVNSTTSFWPYSIAAAGNNSIRNARYIDKGGPNSVGGTTYLYLTSPQVNGTTNSWVGSKGFTISPGEYLFNFSYKWLHMPEIVAATKSTWPEPCSGFKTAYNTGIPYYQPPVSGITKYLSVNCCLDPEYIPPCTPGNYGGFSMRKYAGEPPPSTGTIGGLDANANYVRKGIYDTWTKLLPPGNSGPNGQLIGARPYGTYPRIRIIYGNPITIPSSSYLTAPALFETTIDGYESSWSELSSKISVTENTEVFILFWFNEKNIRIWQKGLPQTPPAGFGGNRYIIGFSNINLQKLEKNEWLPAPAVPDCERSVGENIFPFN